MIGRRVTIGELSREGTLVVGDGYRTKKSEHGQPGLPILRVAEVQDGRIIPSFEDFVDNSYRPAMGPKVSQPGDIVLTTKGTVGRVAMIPQKSPEFVYSPQVCFFRLAPQSDLDSRYLYYWFRSAEFHSQASSRKSQTDMADYLSLADVKALVVHIPDRSVQLSVSMTLGVLDDKIATNERIIATADALASAVFEHFFSAGLNHVTDGTKLPEGWTLSTLGASTTILESGRRPKGGVSDYTSGVPSIGAESITRIARFDFSKVKYIPREFFQLMKRGVLEDRDILIYKDGGRPGDFRPHISLFGNGYPFEEMCVNEHVYRVRMAPPLSQAFGYYWLSTEQILTDLRVRGTGAAIPGINSTAIKGVPVVQPPKRLVDHFDSIVSPLITRVLSAAAESRTLELLRDSLLPELMSGHLRARDAEKIVEDAV